MPVRCVQRKSVFVHRLILKIFLAIGVLLSLSGGAQAQVSSESQLKAAFLVSFMKYVEWPENLSILKLCVRGRDSVLSHLERFQGRLISGRPIEIRRLSDNDSISGCQQLYLSETQSERSKALLSQAIREPMLVTGEGEHFLSNGGSGALVQNDGRIQFDININALSAVGLKVASPMLRLARRTVSGEAGPR